MPPKMGAAEATHLATPSRKRRQLDNDVGNGDDGCCGMRKAKCAFEDSNASRVLGSNQSSVEHASASTSPKGTGKSSRMKKAKIALDSDSETSPIKNKETQATTDSVHRKANKSKKRKQGSLDDDADCVVQQEEKRLRRFRAKPPLSYMEIKSRALTQRLFLQERERCGTEEVPEEKVLLAGTTGNLYTVHIKQVPSCSCPHALKGNQCKHIIYVMLRVLKAPEHIGYQLALTSSELRELFKKAPPIPTADGDADSSDGNRKPIEGECPICYTEFEPDKEAIVYCKAACGNNVHKECMDSWMRARAGKATCPYCRSVWAASDVLGKRLSLEGAEVNEEGYINVAAQLGLSGERDYSTYHQPWVRSQRGYGGYRGYRGDW